MSGSWRAGGLGAILLAGCGGANAGQSDPQPCAPIETPAADVSAAGLAGEYTVRLVATQGPSRGNATSGPLSLVPHDPPAGGTEVDTASPGRFTRPLQGTTEVALAQVGAAAPGDLASTDPKAPGVLVLEAPGRVILRLGSIANRAEMLRFDGAYMALQVQEVTEKGFAGTWRSGGDGSLSAGHFCADRT